MPLIHRSGSTALQPRPDAYEPPQARERWSQAWQETKPRGESDLNDVLRPIVAVGIFVFGWVRDLPAARRTRRRGRLRRRGANTTR